MGGPYDRKAAIVPAPAPAHDRVLKYLRHNFPYERAFISSDGQIYPFEAMLDALNAVPFEDPICQRILCYYLMTRVSRTRVAEEVGFDQSTVKRKLNWVADKLIEALVDRDTGMPEPFRGREKDPRRDQVLAYVRTDFPEQLDFTDWAGRVHPYATMKEAAGSLKDNDPNHHRVLSYYFNPRLTRTCIASEMGCDQSTIKRKLEAVADMIMFRLLHPTLWPADLFGVRHPSTGVVTSSALPITFPAPVDEHARDKQRVYEEDLRRMREHEAKLGLIERTAS